MSQPTTHESHGGGHDSHGGHGDAPRSPMAPIAPIAPIASGPPIDWDSVRNVALVIAVMVLIAWMLTLISCTDLTSRGSSMDDGATRPQTLATATDADIARLGLKPAATAFLNSYNRGYRHFSTLASESEWQMNTKIVEGDDSNAKRNDEAKKALAAWNGSVEVIDSCRALLKRKEELEPLQVRQLEMVLYLAGDKPATAKELVAERIAAETRQTEALFGFTYKLDGKEVTTNELDRALTEEKDLPKRLAAWTASKEVGRGLKAGLEELQRLRNGTVRALGYKDYFDYNASIYGMSTAEMVALNDKTMRELRPLYRELHTYWRHELAKRYAQPVPDLIPAHWLPDRWSQDWGELLDVEGADLNAALKDRKPEWLVEQAEKFYVSLGFEKLPKTFWEKSSLYPVPPDAGFKKNNHATAWHIDLDHDVRSCMSVESDARWYETTHHELGHIYYYLSYSRPEVPYVLREGANPFFHEAIGTMIGLASMQPRFLEKVGLSASSEKPGGPSSSGAKPDPIQLLHKEALFYAVFQPWSCGVMLNFEQELYAKELPKNDWNQRWWELVAKYQGVVPPAPRGEEYCDAATKTHINDNAAQYYKYGLANLFLMQVHDHIASRILREDPHDTNYYGRKEVGDFLKKVLSPGATVDWRQLMRDHLGSELSAEPMQRYFAPLMKWLQQQNQGRKHTLPDV